MRYAWLALLIVLTAAFSGGFSFQPINGINVFGSGSGFPSPTSSYSDANSILLTAASSQYIDFASGAIPAPYNSAWTMEVWWFPTDLTLTSPQRAILCNYNGDTKGFFQLYSNLTTLGMVEYGDGLSQTLEVHVASLLTANTWNHIVVTYDGSNTATTSSFHFYWNGVNQPVTVNHNTAITAQTSPHDTWLGNDPSADPNSGYFNRISYWNTALSSGQVSALYNNGAPANITGSANLVNYYLPGNGKDTASTVYDLQGTDNGTLHASPPYEPFAPFALHNVFANHQIPNDPQLPLLNGGYFYIPYYQNTNTTPGFTAPDLEIYSTSSPAAPSLVGTLATTSPDTKATFSLAINGNYAYLAYFHLATDIMRIVDISDKTNPTSVATVPTTGLNKATAVFLNGNYAYLPATDQTTDDGKMMIVDVSNPLSPGTPTIYTGTPTEPFGTAQLGNLLYIGGNSTNAVGVYDITSPTSPTNPTNVTPSIGSTGIVYQSGNLLFVTSFEPASPAKIEIYDVSTPTSPSSLSTITFPTGNAPQWMVVDTKRKILFAPVSTDDGIILTAGYLYAVSIYDPSHPFIAGTYPMGNDPNSYSKSAQSATLVNGNYLYLTGVSVPNESADGGTDMIGWLDVLNLAN